MNNFKSGSGNLDFGEGDNEENEDEEVEAAGSSQPERAQQGTGETTIPSSTRSTESRKEQYPYFVRRNNVGGERDTRLEIHVRDKVTEQEANFRNDLAERLNVNEVSKTDAREFALLAAFQSPEQVAELMRQEGLGTLR
jgi:hypothetical protein